MLFLLFFASFRDNRFVEKKRMAAVKICSLENNGAVASFQNELGLLRRGH